MYRPVAPGYRERVKSAVSAAGWLSQSNLCRLVRDFVRIQNEQQAAAVGNNVVALRLDCSKRLTQCCTAPVYLPLRLSFTDFSRRRSSGMKNWSGISCNLFEPAIGLVKVE